MRDYRFIDRYLNELLQDVYDQPADPGHTQLALEAISGMIVGLKNCKDVLDVGCGEAFLQQAFEALEIEYFGVCLGNDYQIARSFGRNVELLDFNFLPYDNETFDLIFARHSLEHSPMPLLTLMDWHRIAKHWLCLIMPKPKFWTFIGRNHYSVMALSQCRFLLQRAGWNISIEDHSNHMEYRFLCEKSERLANQAIDPKIYETDDLNWIDDAERNEYDDQNLPNVPE